MPCVELYNSKYPRSGSTFAKKLRNICLQIYCVNSVQIRIFFWSIFSHIRTEYGKIRTRKNSVLGHFSHRSFLEESAALRYIALLAICTFFKEIANDWCMFVSLLIFTGFFFKNYFFRILKQLKTKWLCKN